MTNARLGIWWNRMLLTNSRILEYSRGHEGNVGGEEILVQLYFTYPASSLMTRVPFARPNISLSLTSGFRGIRAEVRFMKTENR